MISLSAYRALPGMNRTSQVPYLKQLAKIARVNKVAAGGRLFADGARLLFLVANGLGCARRGECDTHCRAGRSGMRQPDLPTLRLDIAPGDAQPQASAGSRRQRARAATAIKCDK